MNQPNGLRPLVTINTVEAEAAYGILAAHPLFLEHAKEQEADPDILNTFSLQKKIVPGEMLCLVGRFYASHFVDLVGLAGRGKQLVLTDIWSLGQRFGKIYFSATKLLPGTRGSCDTSPTSHASLRARHRPVGAGSWEYVALAT